MEPVDGILPNCNGHRRDRISSADGGRCTADNHRTSYLSCASENACPTIGRTASTYSCDHMAKQKRKLVLHFDVRNTILVSDSATHDNVEQALNSFLTGVTWGFQDENEWTWHSEWPSLSSPCSGAITYYKSLERQHVRSPADRVRLRQITGDFTRQPIGRKFREYFEDHLQLLEWNFSPLSTIINDSGSGACVKKLSVRDTTTVTKSDRPVVSVDRKLTIVGANGRLYHYLLPSFVKMLYDLQADGCPFAVILRTYGIDAPRVLDSIAHIVDGHHPLFPRKLSIPVNQTPGRIRRYVGGGIHCEVPTEENGLDKPSPVALETDSDIYQYLSDVEGVCGFVDDFSFWQENNYAHKDGKPLWIDPADPLVQHIFFDDNIRVADAEGIVDVRLFCDDVHSASSSLCSATARSLSIGELAQLENVCLVQADLLECLSNTDYFINRVRECELNYSNWLQRHQQCRLTADS